MGKSRQGCKAWLVTWDWTGDHAAVPERDILAAILRPQTSPDAMKRIVELLYAAREYAPSGKLDAMKRNPYPAKFNTIEVEQPLQSGEVFKQTVPFAGQIVCGHNPFLSARLVDNLRLRDSTNPDAGLIWDERPRPDTIRLG